MVLELCTVHLNAVFTYNPTTGFQSPIPQDLSELMESNYQIVGKKSVISIRVPRGQAAQILCDVKKA